MALGSVSYGNIIASGVAAPLVSIADRAYVPGGGQYRSDTLTASQTSLVKFDHVPAVCTTVTSYGNLAGSNFWGALSASSDGYLYGSENTSGEIWRFPVAPRTGKAVRVAVGPAVTDNDGAHSINSVV